MALLLAPRAANASLTALEAAPDELAAAACAVLASRLSVSRSPYTDIGPRILVSLNPYATLPAEGGGTGLYDCASVYRGSAPLTLPPHVFATAEQAAAGVAAGAPQAIVISGESGSGKTEAARLIVAYLAGAATRPAVIERLQQSTLLLEALGNACTANNANSSRFGKLTTLAVAPGGAVASATVAHFLLETHRVTAQAPGERSFHLIHYLEAGAAGALRAELALPPPGHPWRSLRATPAAPSCTLSPRSAQPLPRCHKCRRGPRCRHRHKCPAGRPAARQSAGAAAPRQQPQRALCAHAPPLQPLQTLPCGPAQ
jgi:hypothetical protein